MGPSFFGIGFWEILLILVLALIVVGPQRLPEMAVQLARLVRQLRRYAGQVTGQLREEFDDLIRVYESLREELRQLREEVRQESRPLERDLESITAELRAPAEPSEAAAASKSEGPQETASPPAEGKA